MHDLPAGQTRYSARIARRLARRGRADKVGTPAEAAAHPSVAPFLYSLPFPRPSSIRRFRTHSRATPSCTRSSACGSCRTASPLPLCIVWLYPPSKKTEVCNRPFSLKIFAFLRLVGLRWNLACEKLSGALQALPSGPSEPPAPGACAALHRIPPRALSGLLCVAERGPVATGARQKLSGPPPALRSASSDPSASGVRFPPLSIPLRARSGPLLRPECEQGSSTGLSFGRVFWRVASKAQATPLRSRTPRRSTGVAAVEWSLAHLVR